MKEIKLKAGREASLLRKHHWVFSGAIQSHSKDIQEGDLVLVKSNSNQTLGYGHFSPSNISVRMISFGENEINGSFWTAKLSEALALRERLGLITSGKTNGYRLIHGEGDLLPGLIIDIYNMHAVIQCHSLGMYNSLSEIAKALDEIYNERLISIYNKSAESLGQNVTNHFMKGDIAESLIKENGCDFKVNWVSGQKTGFFLDQRDNRKLLGEYAKGKSVLNLFSYTGGFSVYALANKATYVVSVDVSTKAIELTNANVGLIAQESNHQGVAMDVSKYLSECDQFDLVICDPPAFAKSMNKRHQALNGYKNLNTKVIKRVKSGGLLFTFSCSQVMDRELFQQTILAAALEAKRKVKIIHHLSQAPDHPINLFHPEGSYLKGLVLYIEE